MLIGVVSCYVGYFILVMLVLFGLFLGVVSFVQLIFELVLGGVIIVMFGIIVVVGVCIILCVEFDCRVILIMVLLFLMGLGIV